MSEVHKDETTSLALSQNPTEVVPLQNIQFSAQSPLIKQPGDRIEQHMTPKGDVITHIDTNELSVTIRQYSKKDGSKGKQVQISKQ